MTYFSALLLLALGLLNACRPAAEPTSCQPIRLISPPISCYQSGTGLEFTVEDRPTTTALTWVVFIQKDTATIPLPEPNQYRLIKTSTNRLLLADSLVGTNAKVDLRAFDDQPCPGSLTRFFFVKRYSSQANCFVWQLRSKFIEAD